MNTHDNIIKIPRHLSYGAPKEKPAMIQKEGPFLSIPALWYRLEIGKRMHITCMLLTSLFNKVSGYPCAQLDHSRCTMAHTLYCLWGRWQGPNCSAKRDILLGITHSLPPPRCPYQSTYLNLWPSGGTFRPSLPHCYGRVKLDEEFAFLLPHIWW